MIRFIAVMVTCIMRMAVSIPMMVDLNYPGFHHTRKSYQRIHGEHE